MWGADSAAFYLCVNREMIALIDLDGGVPAPLFEWTSMAAGGVNNVIKAFQGVMSKENHEACLMSVHAEEENEMEVADWWINHL